MSTGIADEFREKIILNELRDLKLLRIFKKPEPCRLHATKWQITAGLRAENSIYSRRIENVVRKSNRNSQIERHYNCLQICTRV